MVKKEKKTLAEYKRDQQLRMTLEAPLWQKGYSIREICNQVKQRMELETLSTRTVWKDIQELLKEYQDMRLEATEDKVTQELARLDAVIREAWEMWEKSKQDFDKTKRKQKGLPQRDEKGKETGEMTTVYAEQQREHIRVTGDPRYLDIILKAQEQRRRLLGLDKLTLDLQGEVGGTIEIKHTYTGVRLATSEEEIAKREGLRE